MPKSKVENTSGLPQDIQQLQERYQQLRDQKVAAETSLKNATEQLEDLKKEAREKYGTDNIDELKKKLQAMKKENEEKRSAYQASLDEIEKKLKDVETKFATAKDGVDLKEGSEA